MSNFSGGVMQNILQPTLQIETVLGLARKKTINRTPKTTCGTVQHKTSMHCSQALAQSRCTRHEAGSIAPVLVHTHIGSTIVQ